MIEKSPLASAQASIESGLNTAGAIYTEAVLLRDADLVGKLGKEPRQYSYDPDKVPTITEDQIGEIEARLHDIYTRDPSNVQRAQDVVNGALEGFGVETEGLKDGILVATIVDREGKRTLRAFMADPSDFGTNILNAELQPTVSQSQNAERHESLPDLRVTPKEIGVAALSAAALPKVERERPGDNPKEKQDFVSELVNTIREKTHTLKESLGMGADSHRSAERRFMNDRLDGATQVVVQEVQQLIKGIEFDEFDANAANRILKAVHEAKTVLGETKAVVNSEVTTVSRFFDEVEDFGAGKIRSAEGADDKKGITWVLNHARDAIEMLQRDKRREGDATEGIASQLARVERIIQDLIETQKRYGRGYYHSVSPLGQTINAIEKQVSIRRASARMATERVNELEGWLNKQQGLE